jgi:hypothetical protein
MLKNKKSNISGGFTRSQLEGSKPKKKKKDEVIEVEAKVIGKDTKKKKQSKADKVASTAVALLSEKGKKAVESQFGKHSDQIIQLLEMNNNDGGITLLKKRLLQMTVNVLPAAEQQLVETGAQKGVYQFATLVSQIRELITDIQADADKKFISQRLAETILRPAFMQLAQDIINDHYEFRKHGEKMVKLEYVREFNTSLRDLAKQLAAKMNDQYKEVSAKMFEALKND